MGEQKGSYQQKALIRMDESVTMESLRDVVQTGVLAAERPCRRARVRPRAARGRRRKTR